MFRTPTTSTTTNSLQPETTAAPGMMSVVTTKGRKIHKTAPLLSTQLEVTSKNIEECLEIPLDVSPEPDIQYYRNAKGNLRRHLAEFNEAHSQIKKFLTKQGAPQEVEYHEKEYNKSFQKPKHFFTSSDGRCMVQKRNPTLT